MNDKLKEQLQKKTLLEIEGMIYDQKRKMSEERDLMKLQKLSSDLSVMQEVHDQKQRASGRLIPKTVKPSVKPELKSYDDYVKSKK